MHSALLHGIHEFIQNLVCNDKAMGRGRGNIVGRRWGNISGCIQKNMMELKKADGVMPRADFHYLQCDKQRKFVES